MAGPRVRILLVDDDVAHLRRLEALIGRCLPGDIHVEMATGVQWALEKLSAKTFDVCFLDYRLGDGTGLDVLRAADPVRARTAFVFLAAEARKDWAYQALAHGAMDYQVKGRLDAFELQKCLGFALFRKSKELELRMEAMRDALTGLGNRSLFDEMARSALEQARRARERAALLFMDVDGLKPVNDTYGHQAGDRLLKMVGARILTRVRKCDILARVGGDEFAALLPRIDEPKTAVRVARDIEAAVTQAPYRIGDHDIRVGVSLGAAIFPDEAADLDTLVRVADARMYRVKARRGGRTRLGGEMAWLRTPAAH
ncbi:MAG: GGDEF domain-containing response regulator [Magnetospirillum sp.]|nr:GGDEF domain-containing response regulator [Magnetospirillum sp.]